MTARVIPLRTIFTEVVDIRERVSGEEHPDTLIGIFPQTRNSRRWQFLRVRPAECRHPEGVFLDTRPRWEPR